MLLEVWEEQQQKGHGLHSLSELHRASGGGRGAWTCTWGCRMGREQKSGFEPAGAPTTQFVPSMPRSGHL